MRVRAVAAVLALVSCLMAFPDTSASSGQASLAVVMTWTSEKQALVGLDLDSARVLWSRGPEPIYEIPLRSGKRLFLKDLRGSVRCLDVRTGRVLWTRSFPRIDWWEAHDASLYVWGEERLACLNGDDGEPRWTAELPDTIEATYPNSDSCVVRCHGGTIRCLNKRGDAAWTYEAGEPLAFMRRVGHRWLVGTLESRRLGCLDARTGAPAWEVSARVSGGSIAPGEEKILTTDGDARVECVDLQRGRRVWGCEVSGGSISVFVVDGAWIAWSAVNRTLARLDPQTGRSLWVVQGLPDGSSVMPCAGGIGVMDLIGRQVQIIDARDGRMSRAFTSRGGCVSIGPETLITVGEENQVIALNMSTGAIRWSSSQPAIPSALYQARRKAIVVGQDTLELRSLETGKLLVEHALGDSFDFAWLGQ